MFVNQRLGLTRKRLLKLKALPKSNIDTTVTHVHARHRNMWQSYQNKSVVQNSILAFLFCLCPVNTHCCYGLWWTFRIESVMLADVSGIATENWYGNETKHFTVPHLDCNKFGMVLPNQLESCQCVALLNRSSNDDHLSFERVRNSTNRVRTPFSETNFQDFSRAFQASGCFIPEPIMLQ